MEETKHERFLRRIMGSDEEFYEEFLKDLPKEQLEKFMKENPDFMQK